MGVMGRQHVVAFSKRDDVSGMAAPQYLGMQGLVLCGILRKNETLEEWLERGKSSVSPTNEKRVVYGLAGISELLGISNVTALKYKRTILKDAVSQQGARYKIVVDADLAVELFNSYKNIKP